MSKENFVNSIIKANEKWVKHFNENKISPKHAPKTVLITCDDARISKSVLSENITEVFSQRSIGNLIRFDDLSMRGALEFSIGVLQVKNILILGHTDCAAVMHAASDNKNDEIDPWVKPIKEIKQSCCNNDEFNNMNQDEQTKHIVKLNVIKQMQNILEFNAIKQNIDTLNIVGGIYNVKTGEIEFIDD